MARAVALLAALVVAGCGADEPMPTLRGALTEEERAWVQRFVHWTARVEEAVDRADELRNLILAGGAETRADFDRAAAPARRCAERLRAEVGDPPSRRLEGVRRLAMAGCRRFAEVVAARSQTLGGDPGDLLARADRALAGASRLWLEADRRLEGLLAWNRPLPVMGGPRETSRIEPRLGTVASMLAIRPVEIRCWSKDDWPGVYAEWQAYTDDTHEPVAFVASFDRGRVSLAPEVCGELVALTYRNEAPAGGESKIDLAWGVGVLAHETEHLIAPGSEAETECYAIQDVRRTARLLGASPEYAGRLAETYWTQVYPRNHPTYRTPQCRDGGYLDRDPADGAWP